ncbi:hypothetical protein [Kitasatospora sp. NBC_01539]|uniref:hypothetical protein n=1 Tax=Kitasatospora sp. NBC_01539 TaxID=2903577 RepID=UPI0038601779
MDDLHGRLREAAEAHRPDRERMLARVERGMERPADRRAGRHRERTRLLGWPKVVLAAVAAAGAMAAGGLAVAAIAQRPDPKPVPTMTASPSVSAAPSPSAAVVPPSPGPSASPTRSPSARPSVSASPTHRPAARPAGSHTEDGPLWADGSVDPHSTDAWAQSNVTLRTRDPLTALTLELHVARTPGAKDAGHWQTLPTADFTTTVRVEDGDLVYRWTLRAGRTVPAGEHVFAGQYDHATGGRDAEDDWYRADTGGAAGTASVWGDFARTD